MDQKYLQESGEEKINIGEDLIEQLNFLKHIHGVKKVQKKISSEIATLKHAISSNRVSINQILCSNLAHFKYLVKVLNDSENVQGVDFPMKLRGQIKTSIRVDIVASNGREWIKVIARNPQALTDIAFGRSNYGAKSILDHATSYVEVAKDNLQHFQAPKIVFDFANQIDDELRKSLQQMNVFVRVNGEPNITEPVQEIMESNRMNIDVTTMMAFVSALTCDSCNYKFSQPILDDQATRERSSSTKAFLDRLLKDKELITCETAKDSFLNILNIVGGSREKNRGLELLKSIKVLPDLTDTEEDSLWLGNPLRLGKKIQTRTHKILSFGLFHKAITVTANKGAIEACKMQGYDIPCVCHEARALTEQKQINAIKLS